MIIVENHGEVLLRGEKDNLMGEEKVKEKI